MRFLLLSCLTLGGCYLSHPRPPGTDLRDAPPLDTPVLDASLRDTPDAGPMACNRLVIAHTAALDGEAHGAVTPRLVALPEGEVGVVYVKTDGDPTRVIYERRAADLSALGEPRVLSRSSFTWAEAARVGDSVFVAYGLGDGASAIDRIAIDGTPRASARTAIDHPALFLPLETGFFWANFDSRSTNAFVLDAVDPTGALLHDTARIELGRYGSGHHAVVRPEGRSVVLGYPREGPPGSRRGYVSLYDESGRVALERPLSDEDITSVWVMDDEGVLVIVSNGAALRLERASFSDLGASDTVVLPPIDDPLVVFVVEGLVGIARFTSGRLAVDVYDALFRFIETLDSPMPSTISGATSVVNVPRGAVLAAGLSDGPSTFPWLARIECAE